MSEILDINGLYIWDNTIFDDLIIPETVNKSKLIDMIIFDCRELSITVSSPSIMKRAINLWCEKNIYYWNKLEETMNYEYNPIENYNRVDDIEINTTNKNTNKQTGTRKFKRSGKDTTEDTLTVAAFNESTLQPREKHTIENTPDTLDTETPDLTTDDDGKSTQKTKLHMSGNIGTMSTQTMIEQERRISDISLYKVIVNSFKNEFCIMKY